MELKIGERIRELRRSADLTQEELADRLGVSPQAVSRWESAAGYPDTETLPRLANCFGVTLDSLFGYDGDRERRVAELLDESDRLAWQNEYGDVTLDRSPRCSGKGWRNSPGKRG